MNGMQLVITWPLDPDHPTRLAVADAHPEIKWHALAKRATVGHPRWSRTIDTGGQHWLIATCPVIPDHLDHPGDPL